MTGLGTTDSTVTQPNRRSWAKPIPSRRTAPPDRPTPAPADATGPRRARPSEHSVWDRGRIGHRLDDIPVFHDLALRRFARECCDFTNPFPSWPSTSTDLVHATDTDSAEIALPILLRHGGADLTFFSTITTFGAAFDITLDEVAVEAYFPGDDRTDSYLRDLAAGR
ncbi:hypothetical protein [Nocardia testacea]|uniref:hypothetical protein n=1 Tax=Nocardia testacea TaxID=248551 RepID=UPI003A8A214F